MAAPTIYTSADGSAPTLNGTAGSLVALLDAILVNGYGAKSAAGWTKPYSSSNYGAYKQGSGGLDNLLWVNDSNTQMARVVGYQTMSDILTGTGPYPTDAQFSGGLYVRKSITANSTARPWLCFATSTTFYLFVFGGSSSYGQYGGGDAHLGFGTIESVTPADANAGFIIAATDTSTTSTTISSYRSPIPVYSGAAIAGHYMAGSYSQAAGAIACYKRANSIYGQAYSGASAAPFPDPATGGLHLSTITMMEGTYVTRGRLPGLWGIGHYYTSFAHLDTFSGNSTLSGRDFMIVLTSGYALAVETNGGW